MALALTADFDTPAVSAMRGSTWRYWRVETPRSSVSNMRAPRAGFFLSAW
ncbi:MAG: hypothetical protein ACREQC_11340 [Candidatus Binataceae bacterium]